MADPYLWSTTASVNSSSDPDINFAEGMLPGAVNNSARAVMAGVAELIDDLPSFQPNYLSGLTLSNNATDAVNDIDIAVGAANDITNAASMILAAALVKKLDASWVVGTNQGMLDGSESVAGTPDTSTWYHIFLIRRPDTGVVDVLASESATAPTMPTNYTQKRRIGAVYNTSGGDIRAFLQYGDRFIWTAAPILDVNANNAGTSAVTRALSVPTGVVVEPIISALLDASGTGGAGGAPEQVFLSALAQTDVACTGNNAQVAFIVDATTGGAITIQAGAPVTGVMTDTSAQIRSRLATGSASTTLRIKTHGWIDTRGK